jgi:hypothetical protein
MSIHFKQIRRFVTFTSVKLILINTITKSFYHKTNKNTIEKGKSNNRALKRIIVVFQLKRKNLCKMLCDRDALNFNNLVISAEGATNPIVKKLLM